MSQTYSALFPDTDSSILYKNMQAIFPAKQKLEKSDVSFLWNSFNRETHRPFSARLALKGPLSGSISWLTKLLNCPVCTPRQLQSHVDPAPLILHSLVCLQGNPRAGRLRDDGHQLQKTEKGYQDSHSEEGCREKRVSVPSLHSWSGPSPWCWCGQSWIPVQPSTRNGRFHRDVSPRDPYDQSSAGPDATYNTFWRKLLSTPTGTESSGTSWRPIPQRLCLVLQIYQLAHPRYWEVVLFPVLLFCLEGSASSLLSWLWGQTRGEADCRSLAGQVCTWMCWQKALPDWQLVWVTKMTSSLSCRESGEELESVSMPSESLLLSSLMLITPLVSTSGLAILGWRPLGLPDWFTRQDTGIWKQNTKNK